MPGYENAPSQTAVMLFLLVLVVFLVFTHLWASWGLAGLFARFEIEPWRGWVPIYNLWVFAKLAGFAPWLMLVPVANLVVLLASMVRLNGRVGAPRGWIAVGVVLFPLWLTLVGQSRPAQPDASQRVEEVAAQAMASRAQPDPTVAQLVAAVVETGALQQAAENLVPQAAPQPAVRQPGSGGPAEPPASLPVIDPLSDWEESVTVLPPGTAPAPPLAVREVQHAWGPPQTSSPTVALPKPPKLPIQANVAAAAAAASAAVSAAAAEQFAEDDDDDRTALSSRRTMRWHLHVGAVSVPLVSTTVVVGRKPGAKHPQAQQVAVADPTRTVSKTHAKLELRQGKWWVTDLGSTNGVVALDAGGNPLFELTPHTAAETGGRLLLGDLAVELRQSGEERR